MDTPIRYDALCERLRRFDPKQLIAVEGFCSSGKTMLAGDLCRDIPAQVINTDSYCTRRDNPPPYAQGVNVALLKQALDARDMSKPCIIEGICLRDVLAICGVSASIFVYIKRVGTNGLWYDQYRLEDYESGTGVPGDEEEPHASDLAYHAKARPHEHADFEIRRVED